MSSVCIGGSCKGYTTCIKSSGTLFLLLGNGGVSTPLTWKYTLTWKLYNKAIKHLKVSGLIHVVSYKWPVSLYHIGKGSRPECHKENNGIPSPPDWAAKIFGLIQMRP